MKNNWMLTSGFSEKSPSRRSSSSMQCGLTLIELLVSVSISSVVLLAVVTSLGTLSRLSTDQKLRTLTQLQAQAALDTMIPELRMLGNGVPFHQSNFLIAQANLSDASKAEPILTANTTANQIQFRLNQTGETYILTADFNPASSSTVTLTGTSRMYVGDEVYITNSTVADDDGFWGRVQSINTATNTVTLEATKVYTPSAIFLKGSLLEVVPIITYISAANYGGVTRNDGNGAVNLLTNGQFTLAFYNSSNSAITLPLVASAADPFPSSAIQNVRSIKVTVQAKSAFPMSNGDYYYATAEQQVSIRNLNFKY